MSGRASMYTQRMTNITGEQKNNLQIEEAAASSQLFSQEGRATYVNELDKHIVLSLFLYITY